MPPFGQGYSFYGRNSEVTCKTCYAYEFHRLSCLVDVAKKGRGIDPLAHWDDVLDFCERVYMNPTVQLLQACNEALLEGIDFCRTHSYCHDDVRFGKILLTYMKFERNPFRTVSSFFRTGYQGVDLVGDIWIELAKIYVDKMSMSVDRAIQFLQFGVSKHVQAIDREKVKEFMRSLIGDPESVNEASDVEEKEVGDITTNNSNNDELSGFVRTTMNNCSSESRKSRKGGVRNIILWTMAAVIILLAMFPMTYAKSDVMPDDDFDSSNKKVKFEDFDTNVTPMPASGGGIGAGGTHESHKDNETRAAPAVTSLGFIHAFIASFSVIVVSELGDKTFFIAAIMAMRHSRCTVFTGAISALGLMTVLSALFGYATTMIPKAITYYVSTALFLIFGAKMLYDGWRMSDDEGAEELEEVQATLRRRDDDNNDIESQTTKETQEASQGYKLPSPLRRILFTLFSRVFLQAFTMTFLAEWGDRSQIATIILAAREDVPGVCIGGVLGHSCCTGLAVIGGKMIAQKISVRTVTIIGGVVFLVFAITSLFFDPDSV